MKPKTCLSMAICLACTVAAHPSPDGDSAAVATERWSLQRCLDYASERNLNIKISEINAESSDIDVRTAKSAFLPSLSANVSQRIVNNPRSENNTIIDGDRISSSQSKTSYNGSYGIDLQWTLYEGNRRLNDYKQQKVASQIARLNVDESINNIQESIMQAYIQILYAAEAVEINRATLASSQAERRRGEELLAAGTLSKADYAQLAADESNDQYALVSAETTLDDYKLQLKQLLELDGIQEIEIEPLDISDAEVYSILPDKEEVYRAALGSRPEIRAGQLTIEQSELSTAAAKSDYMPTLSLSAGIGTNHTNGNDYTFSEQVKTNWNNSIGLTTANQHQQTATHGCPKDTLPVDRELLAQCTQRTETVCRRIRKSEKLRDKLYTGQRAIPSRDEKHRRTPTREKQPARRTPRNAASQIYITAQHHTARLLLLRSHKLINTTPK